MAQTAVVTGATGFLGAEVVKQLLDKGYNVNATVRSLKDSSKAVHLYRMSEALPGKLTLFEANLTDAESFSDAMTGATYVFHVASPFQLQSADPVKELVEPAVQGVTNVLTAAARAKTVQRFVYTASFVACRSTGNPSPPINGSQYTEADWNTTSKLEEEPYFVSKVTAEKKAWELSKELGLDMVAINPTFIFGPMTSKLHESSTSVKVFHAFVRGLTPMLPSNYCDVRDTARAHILAAETPSASGRYIVAQAAQINPKDAMDFLRQRFPQFTFPEPKDVKPANLIDSSKVRKELGLVQRQPREIFNDMATAALQLGIWTPGAQTAVNGHTADVLAGTGVKA